MQQEINPPLHEVSHKIQHTDEKGRPVCKLIFDGAELVGKSTLTSAMYQRLVHAYTSSDEILDGCYYLYCDIGIFSNPLA